MRETLSKLPLIMLCAFVIAFATSTTVQAQCNKNCQKLRTAKIIGIKKVKEFYARKKMTVFSSEKLAYAKGHRRFVSCDSSSKPKAGRCGQVYAIKKDKVYFCTSQLKPFASNAKALAQGYVEYTKCGQATPTPTATPQPTATPTSTPAVPPKAMPYGFSTDPGTRLSDVDTISIAKLNNGNYRMYTSASVSSTDPDTLRFSDSADGLTFGAKTAITGISIGTVETFGYAAHTQRQGGLHVLLFDKIKHISSAGLDINNLMRATSNDGQNFSFSPETIVISDGSGISNNFSTGITALSDGSLRMYYSVLGGRHLTRVSSDDGATWNDAVDISLMGRSSSYAPYPSNLSVVRTDAGKYFLFFTSPPNENVTYQSIYMAESSDGINFTVYDQTVANGSDNLSLFDPNAILLADGTVRVYYVERNGPLGTVVRAVKSLISNTSL